MKNDSISTVGNVSLKGALGARLDAMIANHVAATDVDYITAPFMEKTETRRWWQTEFWGKWMHSAVPYMEYLGNRERGTGNGSGKRGTGNSSLAESVAHGVERMLSSQEPCGYIGNYPDELRCGEGWDVWGMKYTMMGLMHYYDYATRQESAGTAIPGAPSAAAALDACRRLCDYLIAELGPNGRRGIALWQTGNWCGMASSSVLEPVVWLFRRTGEAKYLDFASYIVEGLTVPEEGPRLVDLALKGISVADRNGYGNKAESDNAYVMKHNRWKAYEMMSCYQGMIEYAEAKKEQLKNENEGLSQVACRMSQGKGLDDLLNAAIMTAEDIAKEEVNLAGGCATSEAWFHGASKQHIQYTRLQETCVTTTWMRLCEKLLDITGNPIWADRLEQTFYNAYLGAMKSDGAEFAGYTPLNGSRWHGQHHCFMHTDCCTANGPRGFLAFLRKFFIADGDTATLNFYASALAHAELADGRTVAFDIYSLYPRANKARLVCHTEGDFTLRLRIPSTCTAATVTLNGTAIDGARPGEYFAIKRTWALGDIVEAEFTMPVTAHVVGNHAAFTRGPVLLARDSRFADGDLSEPFHPRSFTEGQNCDELFSSIRPPSDDIWMCFTATLPLGSHDANPDGALPSSATFCDYASAGNTWRRTDYYRTFFPIELGPTDK